MSRSTVRQAFVDWLAPPACEFLNHVYAHPDRETSSTQAMGLSGGGSGGLIWVWFPDKHETPRALPFNQVREVTHLVALEIFFRSVKVSAAQAGADFDTMIEGIESRIRSDPTLGTAGSATPIFSAGLGDTSSPTGQADLRVEQDLPQDDNGSLYIWGRVRLTVVEFTSFAPA